MTGLEDVLRRVVAELERAQIPSMLAGSLAAAAHGLPRATQDVDIVIAPPSASALDAFVQALPQDAYYADIDAARDAYRRRTMFNVVDLATAWKIDFVIRKDRPFSLEEFRRRVSIEVLGVPLSVASPEDTVIAKLEWSVASGGSERQRRDVAGVIAARGEALDRPYIERWVRDLGLDAEWAVAQTTSLT